MTRPDRRPDRGFSIVELLVTFGLFSLVFTLCLVMLDRSNFLGRTVSGNEAASLQLKKAQRCLEMDLSQANFIQSNVTVVPPSLPGGGDDGSAVWFSSAIDPSTGNVCFAPNGAALWQRNVLYYLVVPLGDTCEGGLDARAMDDRCPHKLLVRKVIDLPPATTPTSTAPEPFLTSVAPYLTRPDRFSCSAMLGEPGVQLAQVVATNLLTFFVDNHTDISQEIKITLQAVSLEDAQKTVAIGTAALTGDRHTLALMFSVTPRN